MTKKLQNYVGGKATDSTTQRWSDVFNPALGAVSSQLPMSTAADVDAAVAVAKKAFESWSATPAVRRARVLFDLKHLIDKHMDELAGLVSAEHGKVLDDARG